MARYEHCGGTHRPPTGDPPTDSPRRGASLPVPQYVCAECGRRVAVNQAGRILPHKQAPARRRKPAR